MKLGRAGHASLFLLDRLELRLENFRSRIEGFNSDNIGCIRNGEANVCVF
jgi:hypothetical protein